MTSIIYHILIYFNILSLLIGYLVGKHYLYLNNNTNISIKNDKKKIDNKLSAVSIDDTKFVVSIDTKGIEKKFESIETTSQSDENISDAVNKLKNMKG